jgi:hypothetical protein
VKWDSGYELRVTSFRFPVSSLWLVGFGVGRQFPVAGFRLFMVDSP